jgi:hypothetical protein
MSVTKEDVYDGKMLKELVDDVGVSNNCFHNFSNKLYSSI